MRAKQRSLTSGQIPGVRVGDARSIRDMFSSLKGEFSAIVTSPPYADLQDYRVPNQIGFGQSMQNYLVDLRSVFEACADLSTDNAAMWLVVGALRRQGEVILLPQIVAGEARGAGWKVREVVTWEKSKGLPFTKHGEFRDVTEQVMLLSKSSEYRFDPSSLLIPEPQSPWWVRYPERYSPEGTRPTNVWRIAIPTQGSWRQGPAHSCPFPHELTYRMLSAITDAGDRVLDPFAGVGSVPALANAMDRRGYGVDLASRYVSQYPAVLQDAARWWAVKRLVLEESEARRDILRQTIIQLRLLKFARLTMQLSILQLKFLISLMVNSAPKSGELMHSPVVLSEVRIVYKHSPLKVIP